MKDKYSAITTSLEIIIILLVSKFAEVIRILIPPACQPALWSSK